MAKGKSSGKTYTSQGKHSNVSRVIRTDMRKNVSAADRFADKWKAYLKGQNPWVTIANPAKEVTNKRFIRVRMNDHYGSPKERTGYTMKSMNVGAE